MVLVSGSVLMIIGGCVLVSGVRGRLLNAHPHCRGCGFDLHGIELFPATRCPECGRLISTGGSSVRIGRRKKRPAVLVLGVLLSLIGTVGVSYPLWSQIPAWKNINWYEHLPESMVINMTINGNKDARSVINDRLIPGEVSEEGLVSLIDHAFVLLDDESVPWDEWWGDVLLYAFITDALDNDQLAMYARRAIIADLELKDQITNEETHLSFVRSIRRGTRGMSSYPFRDSLIQSGLAQGSSHDIKSDYTLTLDRVLLMSGSEQLMDSEYVSLSRGPSENQWTPFAMGPNVSTGQGTRLPASEPGLQVFSVEYHFTLVQPSGSVVQWVSSASKPIIRTRDPVYADFVSDTETLEGQLPLIQISDLLIPSDPEVIKANGEGGTVRGIFEIYNHTDPPIGFLGEVVFQSGTEHLPFGTGWLRPDQASGMGVHSVKGYTNRWFEYFIEHASFWDRVQAAGCVDVIIIPDRTLAERYYQLSSVDRIVDHAVIFRDVPVQFYEAISNAPWDPNSARDMATRGTRPEQVGHASPELLEVE